jgi:hypothetical protein
VIRPDVAKRETFYCQGQKVTNGYDTGAVR